MLPRKALGSFLIALVCVWAWNSPLLLPAKWVVVLFHEVGHALAAVATGGEVVSLKVGMDQSGEVLSRGGSRFVTLNAGYLGSLAWGLLCLVMSRTPVGARLAAAGLGVGLGAAALAWARPVFSFGFAWVLVSAAAFGGLARWASAGVLAAVLRVLGVFSMLYAVGDIVDDVLLRPGAPSDAAMLAELTGIPTLVWGLAWTALSLVVMVRVVPRVG